MAPPNNADAVPALPQTPRRSTRLSSSWSRKNDAQPRIAAGPVVKPEPDGEGECDPARIPSKTTTSPRKQTRAADRDGGGDGGTEGSEDENELLDESPTKRRAARAASVAVSPLPNASPLGGPDLSRAQRVSIVIFADRRQCLGQGRATLSVAVALCFSLPCSGIPARPPSCSLAAPKARAGPAAAAYPLQ
jgi:hypothetical protein